SSGRSVNFTGFSLIRPGRRSLSRRLSERCRYFTRSGPFRKIGLFPVPAQHNRHGEIRVG
ncbi:hypothetical protein, partial [Actinomadura macrotermitis]|uniref:hypothetical protein n=1 Tax=Actinomadura macrotermitis TaxID=2585200 RepID=UPI001A9A8215